MTALAKLSLLEQTYDQAREEFEHIVDYLNAKETSAMAHSELERELEKKGRELLGAELSTKAGQAAELQQKLETTLSGGVELENDIEKSRKEIAALQNQLRELKAQQAPAEPVPVIVDVKPKSTSKSEASAEQGESPSPSDIIDWVLKKKAK